MSYVNDAPNQEPEKFTGSTPSQLEEECKTYYESFCDLINEIAMDDRLKILWKQIYKNAIDDRKHALLVWTDLYIRVHGNPEMHALHGDRIAKYLERMEKANTQLLKLAEQVQRIKTTQEEEQLPRGNSLYDKLEKISSYS